MNAIHAVAINKVKRLRLLDFEIADLLHVLDDLPHRTMVGDDTTTDCKAQCPECDHVFETEVIVPSVIETNSFTELSNRVAIYNVVERLAKIIEKARAREAKIADE